MTTRVLLVDDHELMRDGLRALFAQDKEFEVAGEAGDARTAVALAAASRPDVIVMDISLPDLSGIEATRQTLGQAPEGKVVANCRCTPTRSTWPACCRREPRGTC